jgi:2-(1,2-epoxy-1,2-dihydrophenyl)acetyl-CoA isomerase
LPDLIVERANGVVQATLNRPERKNAMSLALFDALAELFADVDARDEDRAVVLVGEGGNFSSGADLGSRAEPGDPAPGTIEALERIHQCALSLHRCRTPTIAAVDGVAVGAGMSLALGCDLVVATTQARFSAIFVRRALSIDFGMSWLLPRLIGLSRAKELALLGEFFDAATAKSYGLVHQVVEPDQLLASALAMGERLAAGPSIALAGDLELLDGSSTRTFEAALAEEVRLQFRNFGTQDTREAIAAFMEKREPNFKGR